MLGNCICLCHIMLKKRRDKTRRCMSFVSKANPVWAVFREEMEPFGRRVFLLGQQGQVKRVFGAWWNRWDPCSLWHAILPLPPTTGVLCYCIKLIEAWKRVRFFLYSLVSSRLVSLKGPIKSWPSYCIYLCSKAQLCCAIFFFLRIGMQSFG